MTQIKAQYGSPRETAESVTLGDFNIFEDANVLVNRLYYAVPKFEDGQFHCSLFYEEATFRKESNGDLTLIHTERKDGQ